MIKIQKKLIEDIVKRLKNCTIEELEKINYYLRTQTGYGVWKK